MNSNLIPVQRPDKNGKLVTRHVRADSVSLQTKIIPAPINPALSAGSRVTEEEYETGVSVVASRLLTMTKNTTMNLASIASHVPDGFREIVKEFSTATDYQVELWGHMLNWENKDREWFAKALLIEMHVMETVSELHPDPIESRQVSGRQSIARGRELMVAARLSLAEHGVPHSIMQRKATIFALWAKHLKDADDRINMKQEIDNIHYIADNFFSVMEHRDTIRARKSIDRDFIESVINTAPAISGGTL